MPYLITLERQTEGDLDNEFVGQTFVETFKEVEAVVNLLKYSEYNLTIDLKAGENVNV